MKKIKKWFLAFFLIILIIAVLWAIKTPIAASYLSWKLKTPVSISKVSIGSTQMIIEDFKLKNLKKTKSKYALIAKKIIINYSISEYFSTPSFVDKILMRDVNLNIDCDNPSCTKNNWTTIALNINEKEKKDSKELIIKNITVENMDIQINELELQNKISTTHIAEMQFNNISSKKGFPTKQLIAAIFRSAGLKEYLKDIKDILDKGFFENILDTFKGVSDNALDECIKNMESK
jgi:hypothetical protein